MCFNCLNLKYRGQLKNDQHELKQNKLVVELKLKCSYFFIFGIKYLIVQV